jgi:hypothetical protein
MISLQCGVIWLDWRLWVRGNSGWLEIERVRTIGVQLSGWHHFFWSPDRTTQSELREALSKLRKVLRPTLFGSSPYRRAAPIGELSNKFDEELKALSCKSLQFVLQIFVWSRKPRLKFDQFSHPGNIEATNSDSLSLRSRPGFSERWWTVDLFTEWHFSIASERNCLNPA